MRTPLFFIAALSVAGCSWTAFDDVSDTTWVRTLDTPNIGSRNFALSILGVTSGPTGGTLGVISSDAPDFSTVNYTPEGVDAVNTNSVKLGQHRIAVLSEPPLFATDGTGRIAIAERSTTSGNISVVNGAFGAPVGQDLPSAAGPDAVAFAGPNVVVAAGNTLRTVLAPPVACANSDTSFGVAAMAADATNLWVWSKTGAFFSYPITALTPCTGGMLPAAGTTFTTTGFMPGAGARVYIVGNFAVLAAHAAMATTGQVFVVNLTTMAQTDTMTVEGLQSSAVGALGGSTYLLTGVPSRSIDGIACGQVDAFALDTTTGTLTKTAALSLSDAQPESGQVFGRSVTTMKFNDQQVIVVAAKGEVFAYYKTALYDALP